VASKALLLSEALAAALQMHGTGTALGDPIEVGAAAAVLVEGASRAQRARLLCLMASKTSAGHSEPAAGKVGVAHTSLALSLRAVMPLLHLRSANPHVAPLLAASSGAWVLPRQCGPSVCPSAREAGRGAVAGISAFAFQVAVQSERMRA
jgi:acyl transferase domain-containing protein